MKLKQNWSIKSKNPEVYKEVIMALGYKWHEESSNPEGLSYIRSDRANNNKVFFSMMTEDDHFNDIESFIIWHFQPEKTEQQLQIEKLKATIQKAQQELEQLKEMK